MAKMGVQVAIFTINEYIGNVAFLPAEFGTRQALWSERI